MKRYTIGLITGILLTTSAFIFMGANKSQIGFGRYQISSVIDSRNGNIGVIIMNTDTGEIIRKTKMNISRLN